MVYHPGSQYLAFLGHGIRPRVKFESTPDIPAPDGDMIALHATCAGIAHMSGAAEHLREFYRDMDTIAVMTDPQAPSELARALKALQVVSATA